MKNLKGNIKKILIGGVVIAMLTAPILRVNYFNGEDLQVRHYSIITSLVEDVKEGSFLTPSIIYGNIYDRVTETYNDIIYGYLNN